MTKQPITRITRYKLHGMFLDGNVLSYWAVHPFVQPSVNSLRNKWRKILLKSFHFWTLYILGHIYLSISCQKMAIAAKIAFAYNTTTTPPPPPKKKNNNNNFHLRPVVRPVGIISGRFYDHPGSKLWWLTEITSIQYIYVNTCRDLSLVSIL